MTKTQYHLATTSHDYRRCNEFLRGAEVEYKHLSFPTVMAERDGGIVGIVSTQPRKDLVVAGPMHVGVDGNPSFVFMRLVECYERVLKLAGVTFYHFFTSGKMLDNLSRLGEEWSVEKVPGDGETSWFRRMI